jgi:hypothetical protein
MAITWITTPCVCRVCNGGEFVQTENGWRRVCKIRVKRTLWGFIPYWVRVECPGCGGTGLSRLNTWTRPMSPPPPNPNETGKQYRRRTGLTDDDFKEMRRWADENREFLE